jgi:hypothetical protein
MIVFENYAGNSLWNSVSNDLLLFMVGKVMIVFENLAEKGLWNSVSNDLQETVYGIVSIMICFILFYGRKKI